MGINGLVISPWNVEALTSVMYYAEEKGVPVVCTNTTVNSSYHLMFVGYSAKRGGTQLGEKIVEYLEDKYGEAKGTVLELSSGLGTSEDVIRGEGFHEVVDQYDGNKVITKIGKSDQEETIVPALSVTKNIFLGRVLIKDKILKVLDTKKMQEKSKEVLKELGLRVSAEQEVRFCSGGERQGVAVARALLFKAKLVILDEPTRAISPTGVKKVMDFIKGMKDEGIAVILISYVFPITDRFVILSRGEKILEKKQKDT